MTHGIILVYCENLQKKSVIICIFTKQKSIQLINKICKVHK